MRGGSQSQLLRCSDGNYYVVKFQNNPQGLRILANELLGSRLAALLGLPAPTAEVIEVTKELIVHSEEMTVQLKCGSTPLVPGLCCGTQYPYLPACPIYDLLPDSLFFRVENLSDFVSILAFDKWTGNIDARQAVFVRDIEKGSYRALMIDYGFCFGGNNWEFPDVPREGLYDRLAVYARVRSMEAFTPFLAFLEQKITFAVMESVAQSIPPEWYLNDATSLCRLLKDLERRRTNVEKTLWRAHKSFPQLFPNWTSEPKTATLNRLKSTALIPEIKDKTACTDGLCW